MSTTVFVGPRRLRLADSDLLGVGGEGRVFRQGDLAIKVFFSMTEARRQKLRAFPARLHARVVGPIELCTDARGHLVGYSMRALSSAVDLHRLGQRAWRAANLSAEGVLAVFRELAKTVEALHDRGVVVGDLNDGNVVLTPPGAATEPWQPWLIDADSMQLQGYPCTVAHERFLDPRLYGVDLERGALCRESDWYALAVLLFTSLLYVHPYGGAHAAYPTLLRRAEARHSALRPDVKRHHAALPPEVLSDDALAWFTRVFDGDAREPLPRALLDARFARCACGAEHMRRACPVCTRRVAAPAPVRTVGKLRVTTMTHDEGRRFVARRADGARLVRTEGDWLVRTASGTRIGQVLAGQTQLAVGSRLGFAFYRAGEVTVSLLFDTERGPLRQLALPHIAGRLVEWSAAFDDEHVLFSTTTEHGGRVFRSAHLIDARGQLLATETGPAGSSAILACTPGKCLLRGAALVPTDDGLVLVRADREARAFVPARAFPETRELVPPDAELEIGPGGSVYVVTHDSVVHLSFEGNRSP